MAEIARVGDLIKAKEIQREDVVAAISGLFDGKTTLPLPNGYELILPDLSKMTPFSRTSAWLKLLRNSVGRPQPTAKRCSRPEQPPPQA